MGVICNVLIQNLKENGHRGLGVKECGLKSPGLGQNSKSDGNSLLNFPRMTLLHDINNLVN